MFCDRILCPFPSKKGANSKSINSILECVGAPDWDPKCFEVDGGFIGCPVWNDCKFKAPDYVCIAKCKGKGTVSVMKAEVKQVGLEVRNKEKVYFWGSLLLFK